MMSGRVFRRLPDVAGRHHLADFTGTWESHAEVEMYQAKKQVVVYIVIA